MADPELEAMSVIASALDGLEQDARERVIRWASARFNVAAQAGGRQAAGSRDAPGLVDAGNDSEQPAYRDFVDLFDAATPKTDLDKALVGAYWLQVVNGSSTWPSQAVNNLLKDTGHGVSNITNALTKAQGKTPALVRQVSKSGRSVQARKLYKLTTSGVTAVRAMTGASTGPDAEET